MPITSNTLARIAGNIASGFVGTLTLDEVEEQEAHIAKVSVSLAAEIAVSVESHEQDKEEETVVPGDEQE